MHDETYPKIDLKLRVPSIEEKDKEDKI